LQALRRKIVYFVSLRCIAERWAVADDCQGCEMASENERLRRKVAKLLRENDRLRKRIRRLLEVIRKVRQYTLTVYHRAAKVMSKHQPRGTWSLWKGKGETAREVYNRLGKE
jgi:hypothetical protein